MTDTPRSNAISPVVFMGSGGPDPTSQDQINKSIGMCRLHGLHNTEATLRALSAALEAEKAESVKFRKGWSLAVDQCDKEYARAEAAEAARDRWRFMWEKEQTHNEELVAERDALKAELARLRALMEARDAFERGEPSQPPETGVQKRAFLTSIGDKP